MSSEKIDEKEIKIWDYDKWNKKKKEINKMNKKVYFKEREIWICYVGLNIGVEQNGSLSSFLRPVLVYKKLDNNHFLGIILSTKKKNKFCYCLGKLKNNNKDSYLLLNQLKTLDKSRLFRKIDIISSLEFNKISKKITELFV